MQNQWVKQPVCEVDEFGNKRWRLNGVSHRLDGPAYESHRGTRVWFQDGLLHRLDGPAFEYSDGSKEYWINGKHLTWQEFEERTCRTNG